MGFPGRTLSTLLILSPLLVATLNASGNDPPVLTDYGPRGRDLEPEQVVFASYSDVLDPGSSYIVVEGIEGRSEVTGNRIFFYPNGSLEYGRDYKVWSYAKDEEGLDADPFSWTLSVTDKGHVYGKVFNWDGEPVENAEIVVDDIKVDLTNENGYFRFRYSEGTYEYQVKKEGYQVWSGLLTVEAGKERDSGVIVIKPEERSHLLGNLLLLIVVPSLIASVIGGAVAAVLLIRERKRKEAVDPRAFVERKLEENGLDPDEDNLYDIMGLEDFAGRTEIRSTFERMERRYRVDGVSAYGEDDREKFERYSQLMAAKDLLLDRRFKRVHDSLIKRGE